MAALVNNSVEGGANSSATPQPGYQTTTPTPPGEQAINNNIQAGINEEDLFFGNNVYKKQFHLACKSLNDVAKSTSRIWFLQQCINLQILPKNSQIRIDHGPRFSQNASQQFTNNLEYISFENLKLGLSEERRHLRKGKINLRESKIQLHRSISEPELHLFIEERLARDKERFSKQISNKHKQKLIFLLKKENRNVPSFLTTESDRNEQQVKRKRNRKFVRRGKYRKKRKKIDKTLKESLVTNYSNTFITKDMQGLLNRGLNFAVTPKNVNTTQVVAGFEKMGRAMKWREHYHNKPPPEENNSLEPSNSHRREPWTPPKYSLPKGAPSKEIQDFITGTLNCTLGSDLRKVNCNLPENEQKAMQKLITLQKNREITIKPTDKTGGIAVMDTEDYIKGMEIILDAKHRDEHGVDYNYFVPLEHFEGDQHQFNQYEELKVKVKEAKEGRIIKEEVAKWLIPDSYAPGRAYGLVKDHVNLEKWPEGSKIPPLRPVVSASGTTFERASEFVDWHSKDLVEGLDSYVRDTPHMLRILEEENTKGPLPPNSIPVTLDVTALYTNIPVDDGLNVFEKFLNIRQDKSVSTSFLMTLLKYVLTCNIFIFNNKFYWQKIGTSMGTKVAPTYACLFMGALEAIMLDKWKGIKPLLFKRYIDDIFFVWSGSKAELEKFIKHMNTAHPFLKFKANYNFDSKKVEFLDTIISISDQGRFKTDLYTKPGKKNSLLHYSSSHPFHILKNIPYSLALRIKRICSEAQDFMSNLDKLKADLLSRGYKKNYIKKAFEKVILIDRKSALKKVEKKSQTRTVLSLQYDPRLPNISIILKNFWKAMTKNPRLKEIFPSPPMITWTRSKNLKDHLIKAKLPKENVNRRSERKKFGFKHCKKDCTMCKFSPNFANHVVCSKTKEKIEIRSNLDCSSSNIIYCITCKKDSGPCSISNPQYIGESARPISRRFNEHKSSIKPETKQAVGKHFSQDGHEKKDMNIIPFEQIQSKDPWIRIAREKYYIKLFDASINVKMN
jgi:hypothetical protein